MRAVLILAWAEVRENIRNRWIIACMVLLLAMAALLTLVGSAPVGLTKASLLSVTTVSLTSLGIYLIPLLALMLSYDTVVGESERGTLLLLLTYPLRRWQFIIGKYLGHLIVLSLAITFGYGASAGYFWFQGIGSAAEWMSFCAMVGSSLLLGAVFIAIGYLSSILVRQRATATGVALGVWLVIVVFYDLLLIGVLVLDTTHVIASDTLAALILLNPVDAYRLLNLAGSEVSALVSGMTDVVQSGLLRPSVLVLDLCIWLVLPLSLSIHLFNRREL